MNNVVGKRYVDILKDEMEDEIRETAMMRTVAELVFTPRKHEGSSVAQPCSVSIMSS